VIKTALTIQLKEQMGIDNIMKREHEIVAYIFSELELFRILKFSGQHQDRLGVISFYVDDLHFNLGVKLNDKLEYKLAEVQLLVPMDTFFTRPRNVS
jgi:selenocysteine lyase/cysteine desulfurase